MMTTQNLHMPSNDRRRRDNVFATTTSNGKLNNTHNTSDQTVPGSTVPDSWDEFDLIESSQQLNRDLTTKLTVQTKQAGSQLTRQLSNGKEPDIKRKTMVTDLELL